MAAAVMNEIRRFSGLFTLGAACLLGIAGCDRSADTPVAGPLAGARIGGPFSLVNQDGERVTDQDFAGQYQQVYFGYAFCPDVCPVDLQRLMQGYRLFEQRSPALAAKLQPIFVTIDPARDTPAVLKTYVAAFHPRLIGLTGTEAEIADVASRYAIAYNRVEGGGSSTDYLMNHSNQTYLFGPDGDPIALIPQDGTPEAIADELAKWMR